MNKLELLNLCVDGVKRTINNGFYGEEDVLKSLNHFSTIILETKDAFLAYAFAERMSLDCYENEARMKAVQFNDLQKTVINSNNEEYMYLFADRVIGADVKSIVHAMPKGTLRKKLERELRPLNEYSL